MAERYLVFHKQWGVYLGSCMGMGFWSKMDPVGQTVACTLSNKHEVQAFKEFLSIAQPEFAADIEPRRVLTQAPVNQDGSCYATIAECVEAGCEAWDPEGDGTE